MCRFCNDPRPLCLEHATYIDDTVERLIEINYTDNSLYYLLKTLSELQAGKESVYMLINQYEFISASSIWQLMLKCIDRKIFSFDDYTDRLVLEDAVTLERVEDMVPLHVYRQFKKLCPTKLVY